MAGVDNKAERRRRLAADLFERCGSALVLYARQWLSAEGAEDAVQRAFIKLMGAADEPDYPKAWLYRVVRNEAMNVLRNRKRRSKHDEKIAQQSRAWFEPARDALADSEEVAAALRALNDNQREAVVLRTWGGMTLSEAAAVMGVSTSAAFDRYRKGLAGIRKHLERGSCKARKTQTR